MKLFSLHTPTGTQIGSVAIVPRSHVIRLGIGTTIPQESIDDLEMGWKLWTETEIHPTVLDIDEFVRHFNSRYTTHIHAVDFVRIGM